MVVFSSVGAVMVAVGREGETKAMWFVVDRDDERLCCNWLWGLLFGGAG